MMVTVYYGKHKKVDAYVKDVLMRHYGYEPVIVKNEMGKPFFADLEDGISISHQKEYCVVALGEGNLGVDIQKIVPPRPKIVSRLYHKNEQVLAQDAESFMRIWCLKESLGKYLGIGMQLGMRHYDFSEHLDKTAFSYASKHFFVYKIDDYILAICTNSDKIKLCLF